jgi:hypothetical protein
VEALEAPRRTKGPHVLVHVAMWEEMRERAKKAEHERDALRADLTRLRELEAAVLEQAEARRCPNCKDPLPRFCEECAPVLDPGGDDEDR